MDRHKFILAQVLAGQQVIAMDFCQMQPKFVFIIFDQVPGVGSQFSFYIFKKSLWSIQMEVFFAT